MAQAVDSIASCASTSGGRKVISNDRRLVRLKADGEDVSIANATRPVTQLEPARTDLS